ncbi:MAG: protein translocase subunit SecD [Anaerocolumna sp.]
MDKINDFTITFENKFERKLEMKSKSKKPTFFIIFMIALLMAYTAIFGISIPMGSSTFTIPGAADIRFGIDIKGGVDAAFEPAGLDRKPTSKELEAARTIIETRLDQQNILDRDVTIDKNNGYIIVRFPWKTGETDFNPEEAMAELGETALLTFQDEEGNVLLEGSHVSNSLAEVNQSTGQYVVSLTFDEEGTTLFREATTALVGKYISIYMDDTLIQSAQVNEAIPSGKAQISGSFTYETAKELSDKINSGSLPFSMITKNHQTISPTLGSGALDVMVQAGMLAFAIICILLILYYRLPGFVACIALLIQISGQILALSIPQMTLTLTGIAGIILSIGMGVDANVIISERINEEIKSGKTIRSAITTGFKEAFSSVFDGNITVLIVGVILMIFGSGTLLSFAYSLLTGIFFNFVAGVVASRLMITSLCEFETLRKPVFYKCISRRRTL